MGSKSLFPQRGSDKIVTVDDKTYDLIRAASDNGFGYGGDTLYELARKVIEADRATRTDIERRARGDFGPELSVARNLTDVIGDRTDGKTFEVIQRIQEELIVAMQDTGFDQETVRELLSLQGRLKDELLHTDEMADQLHAAILQLKGDNA